MSEFTAGVLFLKPNLTRVQQQMQGFPLPFLVRELNDTWGVLFVEGDNYENPPVQPKLLEMSHAFPLLFFQHPEDHGWGYAVYVKGALVAWLYTSYSLDFDMTYELAQQRYPEVDDYFGVEFEPWQALNEEVLASDAYRSEATQQYAYMNLFALQVFGLDEQAIKTLADAISSDTFFDAEKLRSQSEIFKEALGIEEMSWMSYYHLEVRGGDRK